MFTNQCSKCGEGFETKNPKRVICPNCLYPEGAVAAPRPSGPPPQQGYAPQPQRAFQQPGGGFGGGGYNNQPRPYGPPPQQRPYQPHGGGNPGYGQQQHQGYGQQQRPMQPGRPPGPGFGQRPPMGGGGYGPPRPGGRPPGPGGF